MFRLSFSDGFVEAGSIIFKVSENNAVGPSSLTISDNPLPSETGCLKIFSNVHSTRGTFWGWLSLLAFFFNFSLYIYINTAGSYSDWPNPFCLPS